MGQHASAERNSDDDLEQELQESRRRRNVTMAGTVIGTHYQLLDSLLDQLLLEDRQQLLSDALRTQLLQETKQVAIQLPTYHIYACVRLPEKTRTAMLTEGYSVWRHRHQSKGYAIYVPDDGAAADDRPEVLSRVGYVQMIL